MTKLAIRSLVVALGALVAPCPADDAKEKPAHSLVGTWKCVSAKYDGKEANRPEGFTQLKHVTPTQFMWALYDGDGKVHAGMGGSYILKGEEYVETPEYYLGDGLESLKGKAQEFKWKLDGDKWYHTGKLSSGTTVEEVWERVTKKSD
jgi:hypothetical protein